jgi:chromosomal replication initiation ATPase DnaA
MKHHFVKTDNHQRLMAAVRFMEERGSMSSPLCLIHGDPGVGKTRNISQWGAESSAVLVKGHVGMNLDGLYWSISQQLGIKHRSNRTAEMNEQVAVLKAMRTHIVFDEAQFGLSMRWQRTDAAGIEHLRQIGEAANVFVLLVCHNSEVYRFSDSAHIRTRIAHRAELQNATERDTIAFVRELADIEIGDGVGELVHRQTGGKYRLVENAITCLERVAKVKNLDKIEVSDVGSITLVVDHEQGLIPKIAPKTNAKAGGAR